ncbi:MAG: DUF975 family protein [Coriobacteriia bacterium]|nr:DUF975 family protein [Coriobacteriia bacterium]
MNSQQNYYGKNIVIDPASVFKRVSWEALNKRLGLPLVAGLLWSLVSVVVYVVMALLSSLIMQGLLQNLTSLLYEAAEYGNPYIYAELIISFLTSSVIPIIAFLVLFSIAYIVTNTISAYGLANLALRYRRERDAGLSDVFAAFTNFSRVVIVVALRYLLVVAWCLVPCIGIVLGIVATYRYRLALFIIIDEPSISGIEAIRESKRLMYGNKGQLFVQDATFYGWFAGMLSVGGLLAVVFSLAPFGSFLVLVVLPACLALVYGLWSLYLEIAASAFYDQARAGTSVHDSENMAREGIAGLRQGDVRPAITALSGSYNGAVFRFEPDEEVVIGRDSALSDIVFNDGADKISRKHLSVRYDSSSQSYIVLDFSSNGTYTDDGRQLVSNVENKMPRGTVLVVGSRTNTIRLD